MDTIQPYFFNAYIGIINEPAARFL